MEIVWRRAALNDLQAIREFIAEDNPDAAGRIVTAIHSAAERLADHSRLGRTGRVAGTRELVIPRTPYIVAYRIVADQIRVLAVIHASRR